MSHSHVFGAMHSPCAPHEGLQTGVEQVNPLHPVLHVHVEGAVHVPCVPQVGLQTGLQKPPVYPVLQRQ